MLGIASVALSGVRGVRLSSRILQTESGGTLSPEPIHHSFKKEGGEGQSGVVLNGTEISVVNLSKTDHEVGRSQENLVQDHPLINDEDITLHDAEADIHDEDDHQSKADEVRNHLEKKQTRLRTYTKSHKDICKQ
ncbi:hypothetical protein Tco_1532126 [Tanacetum coccineum]